MDFKKKWTVSVVGHPNGSSLTIGGAIEERVAPVNKASEVVGASTLFVSTWKTNLKSIGYWAAWVAFGTWAVQRDHYYLMNGWWMVLLAFWFTANAASLAHPLPGRLRFFSLALVTIAAAFLIYGTFEWLQEIADGWSWGPPGQRLRLVAIPLRTFVAAFLTAALLVQPIRRHLEPYTGTLLIIAALPVGLAEYGSAISSPVHWWKHWLGSCIELFSVIILPLVLAAINGRLQTIRRPNGRFVNGLVRLWRGETRGWVALLIVYPLTLAGVFWLTARISDLYKHVYSDWEYANLKSVGWVLLVLILVVGSLITLRSLNRGVKKGKRIARWSQGVVVLLAAPFLLVVIFGEGFNVGHVLIESSKAALGSSYDLEVPDHSVELRLSGEVTYGLADRLKIELEKHPGVTRIRLESGGGNILEASRAAKIIAAQKLDTVVSEKCSSACTVMFVAGKIRTLEKDAGLGFHAARSQDPTESAAGSFRAALSPYGVDKGFIKHVEATKPSEMWYPTRRELVAAQVLSEPPGPVTDVTVKP